MNKFLIILLTSLFVVACVPEATTPSPTPTATQWFADTDGDGYGDSTVSQEAVVQPADYVADNTDCNDGDIDVNPSVADINDDKDNNCDGTINDGPFSVGDRGPAGGWVFHKFDATTGLEAAPVDLGTARWGCGDIDVCFLSTEIGTGASNAAKYYDNAFKLTRSYTLNGFDDWFLPSKDELNAMYTELYLNALGSFSGIDSYWSSSEGSPNSAWFQDFLDGNQLDFDKELLNTVRAVRAF